MEEGYSYGYNNARDAVSLTPRRQIEPLLLPDQFMNLPRLNGYIKFPDGFPAAPVKLTPQSWPSLAEGFIARAFDETEEPAENVASPAASDEGQDKAIASGAEPDTDSEDGEEGVTQSAATQHELIFAESTEIGDGEPISDVAPELLEANITDPSMDMPQKPVDEEERAQSLDPKGDGLERPDLPDPSDPANKSRSLSGPAGDVGRDLREGAVRDELDRDIGEYDM